LPAHVPYSALASIGVSELGDRIKLLEAAREAGGTQGALC